MKVFVMLCVFVAMSSLALAQNSRRADPKPMKSWELMDDATGKVLASCDEKLTCVVQDDLKRMIACHERLGKALNLVMFHVLTEELDSLNRTYQECVGGSK